MDSVIFLKRTRSSCDFLPCSFALSHAIRRGRIAILRLSVVDVPFRRFSDLIRILMAIFLSNEHDVGHSSPLLCVMDQSMGNTR